MFRTVPNLSRYCSMTHLTHLMRLE